MKDFLPHFSFNERAEMYDKEKIANFRRLIAQFVAEVADPKPEEVILDIGTGTGDVAFALAKGAEKVIGIDVSENMLEVAKEKAKKQGITNVEFRMGTFLEPCVKEKIDVIVSSLAFHHLSDQEKIEAIGLMKNLLKEDGRVIIGDVMFFFDSQKEKMKMNFIKGMVNDIYGGFFSSQFDSEHPPKAIFLKSIFSDFELKITEILPILGILEARRGSDEHKKMD